MNSQPGKQITLQYTDCPISEEIKGKRQWINGI